MSGVTDLKQASTWACKKINQKSRRWSLNNIKMDPTVIKKRPPTYAKVAFRMISTSRILLKSKLSTGVAIYIYIFIKRHSIWNSNSNTLETDRLQHDPPTSCVIGHQYSSATFVLFRFHFRKEKFGALYKNATFFHFLYFLKKLCKSEIVLLVISSVGECL